jgi:dynein heavy chain
MLHIHNHIHSHPHVLTCNRTSANTVSVGTRYLELQRTIDNFTDVLPLLESMADPAVLARHWERMEVACGGYRFDVTNPTFELRGVMEGPILAHKEDLEDICISAVKERDIEAKLNVVVKEWSSHVVSFATFKARGELLVKATDLSELVTVMEDSLMVLSGLMSNR